VLQRCQPLEGWTWQAWWKALGLLQELRALARPAQTPRGRARGGLIDAPRQLSACSETLQGRPDAFAQAPLRQHVRGLRLLPPEVIVQLLPLLQLLRTILLVSQGARIFSLLICLLLLLLLLLLVLLRPRVVRSLRS